MKELLLVLCLLLASGTGRAQPTWTFAHPINDANGVMDVATGADGNFYITGRFTGTMQLGTTLLTSPGLCLYVAKCRPTGEVLHVTQLETTKDVLPTSMAVDQAGNGYVTGNFNGTLSCQGGRQSISQQRGDNASFVLKTRPDGEVQWLRQAEKTTASAHDFGTGANVAVDEAGNCYVTGSVGNVVAATGPGGPGPPEHQAFLLSYDASGTVRWAREWASLGAGSHSTSKGVAVAVGRNGQCFVSSEFYRGCKLGSVTLQAPANAYSNYFLARFDATTGDLTWTSVLPADVAAKSVALDHSGRAYVGGSFSATAAFGAITLAGAGPSDGFVARYNPQGSADYDAVNDLAVDQQSGKVFATGITNFASDPTSRSNAFLTELTPGGKVLNTEMVAGPGTSSGGALALDEHDNIYTAGIFSKSCGFGTHTLSSPHSQTYLARYGSRNFTITGSQDLIPASISVFPNPAQHQFAVQLQGPKLSGRATLYNQLGQVVAEQPLTPANGIARAEFPTAALPDGLYVLRLASPIGTANRAVVVQH